ncbi:hypothetical protein RISK_001460 [Rhodopirellula islandica]|uniref:Uncharacterized protein n=1 Tax=Rhodopirellula islandica TaxID=595434 RepID=A0A0J1EL27_RHOIS|nr:hypothetical protein RISK_001460 [Rhodopirellula islandica]
MLRRFATGVAECYTLQSEFLAVQELFEAVFSWKLKFPEID